MAVGKILKLKVLFDLNTESIEQTVSDVLITQLMVTIARIGLRTDQLKNNVIINKENEHGEQKK